MTEKILVIGRGFLGNTIVKIGNAQKLEIIGTHVKNELCVDIQSERSVEKILDKINPDILINCAAFTNVDEMERNPELGYGVNFRGVQNLVKSCSKRKISLIQISTDSVFDGEKGNYSEEDTPNPINEYAKSKFYAEKAIEPYLEKSTIIRTNLYGYNKEEKFLFNWIIKNLKKGITINGFDDVFFNPLEKSNLSEMIIEIAKNDIYGILHLASDKILSKYQFAQSVAERLDFPTSLIKRSSIKENNLFAKRPLNTSLSNLKMKKILKTKAIELDDWLISNYEKIGSN